MGHTASLTHPPGAEAPYRLDWSAFLDAGDSITSATVTVDESEYGAGHGLTVDPTVTNDADSVTFWLRGGTDGRDARLVCTIQTVQGITEPAVVDVMVRPVVVVP